MRFRRLPAGAGTAVELCVTDRYDGDFRIDAPADELAERRRRVSMVMDMAAAGPRLRRRAR